MYLKDLLSAVLKYYSWRLELKTNKTKSDGNRLSFVKNWHFCWYCLLAHFKSPF